VPAAGCNDLDESSSARDTQIRNSLVFSDLLAVCGVCSKSAMPQTLAHDIVTTKQMMLGVSLCLAEKMEKIAL